jgi:hypothetical protein
MAELLLFQHAHGQTPGFLAATGDLRALPASGFGDSWPRGAPLQIHMMEEDPWAEEDLPEAVG